VSGGTSSIVHDTTGCDQKLEKFGAVSGGISCSDHDATICEQELGEDESVSGGTSFGVRDTTGGEELATNSLTREDKQPGGEENIANDDKHVAEGGQFAEELVANIRQPTLGEDDVVSGGTSCGVHDTTGCDQKLGDGAVSGGTSCFVHDTTGCDQKLGEEDAVSGGTSRFVHDTTGCVQKLGEDESATGGTSCGVHDTTEGAVQKLKWCDVDDDDLNELEVPAAVAKKPNKNKAARRRRQQGVLRDAAMLELAEEVCDSLCAGRLYFEEVIVAVRRGGSGLGLSEAEVKAVAAVATGSIALEVHDPISGIV